MVNSEVTISSIFNELTTDARFTEDEKCQSLFSMSYSGDEFPIELFNSYAGGYCLTLDYSEVLKIMGEEEGDNDN